MQTTPVLVAGGGPVGLTLAKDLARRGVACVLVERNATTTRHPKMDITNVRSMELFARWGIIPALRAAAVPESHPFDVSWVTTMAGHELHRFRYASVDEQRREIRERNDGSQAREPAMRVSQVDIEPVLKRAVEDEALATVRFGVALEDFEEDDSGVTVTVRRASDNEAETYRCQFLVGCDGGGSQVREKLGFKLEGTARVMKRFMTHFRSDARAILQRWGAAWHYQSLHGTLIAQNDRDTWTLHTRLSNGDGAEGDPYALVRNFLGADVEPEVLVANPWTPHLLVADRYASKRAFVAGDAAHQYIPTGGYGMNTGIGDAFDLGWKLAAAVLGFGGPGLLESFEPERRPVGVRNCAGSRRHNEVRLEIAGLYGSVFDPCEDTAARARGEVARAIARIGNAENECKGLELGYHYAGSPIVAREVGGTPDSDPLQYIPTTLPGARLPSMFLDDGTAVYDRLGPWFTLIACRGADGTALIECSGVRGVPVKLLRVDDEHVAATYGAALLLVRPDHHVAWRGRQIRDSADAHAILSLALGWV